MLLPANFTFDEAAHHYHVAGVRWPSVTEVLQPLQMLEGIPWSVLEAAAKFGTHVHQACHLFNLDQLDRKALDPALAPYLDAWERFLLDTKAVVVASEQRVAHARYRYAGTLDVILRWNSRRVLMDYKSAAVMPRITGPQTAGYAEAVGEPRIDRAGIHLRPDGTYRVHRYNGRGDLNTFISALNIHNWRLAGG